MAGGKPPKELAKFYERNNLADPEDPDAAAAKADDDAAGKKGKGKEAKKDKGKKGKGKKAGGDDDGDESSAARIGPSECVGKFDDFYRDYNETWADRDETENYD